MTMKKNQEKEVHVNDRITYQLRLSGCKADGKYISYAGHTIYKAEENKVVVGEG